MRWSFGKDRTRDAALGRYYCHTEFRQCALGGVVAAHSVDSASRRSRCRTDIDVLIGSCIAAPRWSKQDLAKVHATAANIASDQVGVHSLEICAMQYIPGQHDFAESRGKAFNLALDVW